MIPKGVLEGLRVDMQEVANLAAATGVSYFKGAFRSKAFDGKAWPRAKVDEAGKRRRGSLMVQSAALMNSVRTAEATPDRVVWAAGNEKVPYAQVHNEGGRAGRGAGFDMPKRQFMGEAEELEEQIGRRINIFLQGIFK
ncbi:Phage virion morphogenesis family protein [Alistipes timonensis JC136]|uniref:Phage virion morphogenesis family protein n=1 Tax=Alistipes timonensis JC136 TaxID=1033731 RepID=A0A1H4DBQ2_9BACT|nr:phage virion morphogenesis protein [Alistipes timonensis]SEA70223.1 Phage virion morphogenesis family protein [Alistipes timonensis JC136]